MNLDWNLDDELPCDVTLPPSTVIRAGVPFSSLLTALSVRRERAMQEPKTLGHLPTVPLTEIAVPQPGDAEREARAELLKAIGHFDTIGDDEHVVSAIDKLVTVKIDDAMWEMAQRIESSLGVLP